MDSSNLCNIGKLPREGELVEASLGDRTFCVARLKGKAAVLDNECPHHGAPLGQGVLRDGKVVCPWHAYGFDLETGACDQDPDLSVRVFDATVEGDDVLVRL
jgi:nitrite reductase (NADH) small subunit